MLNIDLSGFLKQHQLPQAYKAITERWFARLANDIATHQKRASTPIVIGINGAQGSGKSTLADLLVFILQQQYQLKATALSLDDFYFTRQERLNLAEDIHPLLATRGVPGTHDIGLACKTINALLEHELPVAIPRFNKAIDDRFPATLNDAITEPVDVIVLEGWCLGSQAQPETALNNPVNELEAEEDPQQQWRSYVNQQLAEVYPQLFDLIDIWVMLKAPSFDCVFSWRLEQEEKLKQRLENEDSYQVMDGQALARFIKFYQRITEQNLISLPSKMHYLYELDAKRQIIKLISNPPKITKMYNSEWLIFTDMDGSLLNHHDYHFDEAMPTLDALEKHQIPVIPVTSKTQAELELLRHSLNNTHPFIVENGAAIFIPVGYFDQQPEGTVEKGCFWVKEFVDPRARWQSLIDEVRPKYGDQFKTFAEVGIDGIIAMTGLNVHSAARSARREYGEPVAWHGSGKLKQEFINDLKQLGAEILEGGRFIHVSGHCDKGLAIQWLTAVYQQNLAHQKLNTLAIGDSQNDVAMLEVADYALLIRSPVHALPKLERQHKLYVSTLTAPKGWAEGVNKIIDATLHSDSSNQPRGNHG